MYIGTMACAAERYLYGFFLFLKSSLAKYTRGQCFISLSPFQRAKPTTMISFHSIHMMLLVPGLLVIPIDEITIAKLRRNLPVDGWIANHCIQSL